MSVVAMSDHLVKYQFKKGDPRTKNSPGRPKKRSALDVCEEMGFDPFEAEVLFARNDWKLLGLKGPVPPTLMLKATQHLTDKIYPSLKAIELKDDLDEGAKDDRVVVILPSNDRELESEVSQVEHKEVIQPVGEPLMGVAKKCSVPIEDLDSDE